MTLRNEITNLRNRLKIAEAILAASTVRKVPVADEAGRLATEGTLEAGTMIIQADDGHIFLRMDAADASLDVDLTAA
jgi:hypothetical protein